MSPAHRSSARTRILDAADRMFAEQGVRVVGVEAIVAAADTAKTTLYGQFGSKDALVVAYLERRAAQERRRLEQALAAHGGQAIGRVLHLYDLLAEELAEPGYRGSPFVNACVELGHGHPAAAVAHGHRQWLLATFTFLTTEAAVRAPEALAAQLLQLYEGAALAPASSGDTSAARTAKAAAETLLRPTQPTPLPGATGGSPEAHRLVAFLNSAHLPDGDDQLADDRAGPWLTAWLTAAGTPPPTSRGAATPAAITTRTPGRHDAIDGAAPGGLSAIDAAAHELDAGGAAAPGPLEAVAELRVLREGLRQLAVVNCGAEAEAGAVAGAAAVLARAPLFVDLEVVAGEPRLTAVDDSGATRLAVAVAVGAYLAVRARGEWPRLKVCASPDCRWAFLDTTRNRSRRWCDMAGCGNRAKSRAWRDRKDAVTSKIV